MLICAMRVWSIEENTFDTVHGTIGDEDVLVSGIIRDAAMMRLAWQIIGCGYGVGTHIGGARERRADGRLYGECDGGGVR